MGGVGLRVLDWQIATSAFWGSRFVIGACSSTLLPSVAVHHLALAAFRSPRVRNCGQSTAIAKQGSLDRPSMPAPPVAAVSAVRTKALRLARDLQSPTFGAALFCSSCNGTPISLLPSRLAFRVRTSPPAA